MEHWEVYLIHFTTPYLHAAHYCGRTKIGVKNRMRYHHNDPGPLIRAAKKNGSQFIVSRVWKMKPNDYERKLKNQGGLKKHCPICARGDNMGEYLSVKRRVWRGINRGCKFCGNKKKVMFSYNHDGPFCDKPCYVCYNGTFPYQIGFSGDLPIEYVKD